MLIAFEDVMTKLSFAHNFLLRRSLALIIEGWNQFSNLLQNLFSFYMVLRWFWLQFTSLPIWIIEDYSNGGCSFCTQMNTCDFHGRILDVAICSKRITHLIINFCILPSMDSLHEADSWFCYFYQPNESEPFGAVFGSILKPKVIISS